MQTEALGSALIHKRLERPVGTLYPFLVFPLPSNHFLILPFIFRRLDSIQYFSEASPPSVTYQTPPICGCETRTSRGLQSDISIRLLHLRLMVLAVPLDQ